MRLNIILSRYSIKLVNGMYETTMKGSIIINYIPEGEFDLISKEMVDNMVTNIDLSKLETVISKNNFPDYGGDFVKSNGEYNLKTTSLYKPGHLVFAVNEKGLLVSSEEKISSTTWGSIEFDRIDKTTFPKTPEGLGIKEAITLDGKGETLEGFAYIEEGDRSDAPVTYKKADDYFKPLNEYKVGDIIMMEENDNFLKKKSGFLELDSRYLDKNKYSELYKFIGDAFSNEISRHDGVPWKMTENLHTGGLLPLGLKRTYIDNNVSGISGFGLAVTKNKVFIFGGYKGDRRKPLKTVYMANIEQGIVSDFTRIGDLPEARVFSVCLAFGGCVFLIGGTPTPDRVVNNVKILKAEVLESGDLGPWEVTDFYVPGEMSNPAIFVKGRRMNIIGGVRHLGIKEEGGKYITMEENNKYYIWCNIDRNNNFSSWYRVENGFLNNKNSDISCPGNRRKGIFFANSNYPEKPGNLRLIFSSNITDNIIFTDGKSFGAFGSDGLSSIRTVGGNSTKNLGPYTGSGMICCLTFSQKGHDGYKYPFGILRYWHENNLYVGWSNEKINLDESPLERWSCDVFVTTDGFYVIGGVSGNYLENYDRTLPQPILQLEGISKNGQDDYTPYFKKSTGNESSFRLPYLEPYLGKGKTYRYYIYAGNIA